MAIEIEKDLRIMFVDDSSESRRAVQMLLSNGYEPQIVDIKDAALSSDRPLRLPWLLNALGEFAGFGEIEEFVKRIRLETKQENRY